MPEEKGKLHPREWELEWISSISDDEIRAIVAEELGYQFINELTPAQEELIPVYRKEWEAIALFIEPINRDRADAADFRRQLNRQLEWHLSSRITSRRLHELHEQLFAQLENEFGGEFRRKGGFSEFHRLVYADELWTIHLAPIEFYFEVLHWDNIWQKKWPVLKSLVRECGWIFPFERFCLICDRPRFISFDNEQVRIEFADGYSL